MLTYLFNNQGALKTREWKTREWKTWQHNAGVENAGVETAKCTSCDTVTTDVATYMERNKNDITIFTSADEQRCFDIKLDQVDYVFTERHS